MILFYQKPVLNYRPDSVFTKSCFRADDFPLLDVTDCNECSHGLPSEGENCILLTVRFLLLVWMAGWFDG
jgi:hypothetical protein